MLPLPWQWARRASLPDVTLEQAEQPLPDVQPPFSHRPCGLNSNLEEETFSSFVRLLAQRSPEEMSSLARRAVGMAATANAVSPSAGDAALALLAAQPGASPFSPPPPTHSTVSSTGSFVRSRWENFFAGPWGERASANEGEAVTPAEVAEPAAPLRRSRRRRQHVRAVRAATLLQAVARGRAIRRALGALPAAGPPPTPRAAAARVLQAAARRKQTRKRLAHERAIARQHARGSAAACVQGAAQRWLSRNGGAGGPPAGGESLLQCGVYAPSDGYRHPSPGRQRSIGRQRSGAAEIEKPALMRFPSVALEPAIAPLVVELHSLELVPSYACHSPAFTLGPQHSYASAHSPHYARLADGAVSVCAEFHEAMLGAMLPPLCTPPVPLRTLGGGGRGMLGAALNCTHVVELTRLDELQLLLESLLSPAEVYADLVFSLRGLPAAEPATDASADECGRWIGEAFVNLQQELTRLEAGEPELPEVLSVLDADDQLIGHLTVTVHARAMLADALGRRVGGGAAVARLARHVSSPACTRSYSAASQLSSASAPAAMAKPPSLAEGCSYGSGELGREAPAA
ncbi:hypothetical protein T492DRAFT_467469 [Pavlovales sp. CCMP2436]|nr:hypothetical protein T492DRAFT_467469 [Pavlovales sp. CCMP2436]